MFADDERAESLALLREWYPKGAAVYTITRSVSRSGTTRSVAFLALLWPDGNPAAPAPRYPGRHVARVLMLSIDPAGTSHEVRVKGDGLTVREIVNDLSRALYGRPNALVHIDL